MVVTLVCVIAAFVIFFQFVRPAYLAAQEVRAEVISRENFLESQEAAVAQVQLLIEKYRSDEALHETVSRVIPSTPDVGGALYQLTAIAGTQNIPILSTSAQTPQLAIAKPGRSSSTVGVVRPLGIATFQVRYAARYEDIKAFIEKLESNVRLMDVTGVTVTQASGNAPGVLSVDMSVATYYQVSP